MKPTRRVLIVAGVGVLFALAPVVLSARLWTFWPAYVGWLVLACGIDALLAPRRGALARRLVAPATLYIGGSDTATLEVELPVRRRVVLDAVADLSEQLVAQPRGRFVARDGRCTIPIALRPLRRGTARIEAVWLRYTGPLGLMALTVRWALDHAIPVVPDVRPVHAAAIRFHSHREFRAGLKIERFRGEGTEFESLKEFVPGDDNRAIDWKPSARHRRLLARQFRAERNHHVVLAVDTGHLMAEAVDGMPKLDHALNAALLLAYVCLKGGDRTGFYTFDARPGLYMEPRGGMEALRRMTRMSSQVAYSDAETNFTLGLTTLAQRVRRRALVIVLTDFVDTISAELMLENLQRLTRRHVVLFVALRDPDVGLLTRERPRDTLRLNRAVVAQTLLREREVVLHRLRRMGALALDTEPQRVGPRLIDRYLEIKRRERV